MLFDLKADQILFQQVFAFVMLLLAAFVESGLGLVPSFYGSAPKISFCLLFLTALYRPLAVPLYPVMLVGLIYDTVQGSPFGYTSSLYLIILGVVEWRRQFLIIADPSVIWSEFVIMLSGLMVYIFLVFFIFHGAWPPFAEILFQIGFTALLFPIFNWMIAFGRQVGIYLGGDQ